MKPAYDKHKVLKNLKKDWEDLARLDPFWAILSTPEKQFGKWDETSFFKTANEEIEFLFKRVEELGFFLGNEMALDFGCGIGRFTKVLASRFNECYGVDISSSMIDKAKQYHANIKNCHFVENSKPDLTLFPSKKFDLIYSNIVLQHIPEKPLIFGYLEEFLRLLKEKGLLVFQLPSEIPNHYVDGEPTRFRKLRRLGVPASFLYRFRKIHPIIMNFIPEEEVCVFLEQKGGKVLSVDPNEWSGPGVESRAYYVTLKGESIE